MSSLDEIIDEVKIDYTKTVLIHDGGSEPQRPNFELMPEDFLRFAKEDFEQNHLRGFVNALTNSKRAIDCKIDEVFEIFGIDFDKHKNPIIEFVKKFDDKNDTPLKLELIKTLNFAPSFIVTKTRSLRNRLEHDYQNPYKDEVKEAIDIAELFIGSIEGKIRIIEANLSITDTANYDGGWHYDQGFGISFSNKQKRFYASKPTNKKIIQISKDKEDKNGIAISQTDIEFYGLIRLTNSINDPIEIRKSLWLILDGIGKNIPEEQIKIAAAR